MKRARKFRAPFHVRMSLDSDCLIVVVTGAAEGTTPVVGVGVGLLRTQAPATKLEPCPESYSDHAGNRSSCADDGAGMICHRTNYPTCGEQGASRHSHLAAEIIDGARATAFQCAMCMQH